MKSKLKERIEEVLIQGAYWSDKTRAEAILSLIKKEILLGMPKKYKSDWCMNEAERKYVEGENDTLKEVRDYIKSLE